MKRLFLPLWPTVVIAAATACSHRSHLRKEYRDAAALAIDAIQKASQFRDSAAELFEPRKADMVGDDVALQVVTRSSDPVESRLSSQIANCDKALRSYRESLLHDDVLLTERTGDVANTCLTDARTMLAAAQ